MLAKDIPYAQLANDMRRRAHYGLFTGGNDLANQAYLARCRKIHYGTVLIFTRDSGHHACGWWKNPDYERCWHLSMSAAPQAIWTKDTPDLDRKVEHSWIEAFFGTHLHLLWAEPPYSPEGKKQNVWHWRLFTDERWEPILPRGEVYSKELTEAGWKTFSEAQADRFEKSVIIAP